MCIVSTDPMFLLILCSYWSRVPTDPVFLLILCSYWSCVPTDPVFLLILFSYWSYVPTDPMFLRILCYHWSYVPTDFMFLLILCSYWCHVPTVPVFHEIVLWQFMLCYDVSQVIVHEPWAVFWRLNERFMPNRAGDIFSVYIHTWESSFTLPTRRLLR